MRSEPFVSPRDSFHDCVSVQSVLPGRFQLLISYACPWSHRTLLAHALLGLEEVIPVSVANPVPGTRGWTFGSGHDLEHLDDIYRSADPSFQGRICVPVLWDNVDERIVNNDSGEILRILATAFMPFSSHPIDLFPAALHDELATQGAFIEERINRGVDRVGYATSQTEYEEAFDCLFFALDILERRLEKNAFLLGEQLTEVDLKLFPTLIRFDIVYYILFKCNQRLIVQYPNLGGYLRCLYQQPAIRSTCHFDHIKEHYYLGQKALNPKKIIPRGPWLEVLDLPHDRGPVRFFERAGQTSDRP